MSKPKMIGTVLPTRKSLECSERYARSVQAKQDAIARRNLSHCKRVYKGWEWRYYETEDRYAVISDKTFEILWFTVHFDKDGEYSMRVKK